VALRVLVAAGGELLVVAFLLSALKTRNCLSVVFMISLASQILAGVFLPDVTALRWLQFLAALASLSAMVGAGALYVLPRLRAGSLTAWAKAGTVAAPRTGRPRPKCHFLPESILWLTSPHKRAGRGCCSGGH